MPAAKRVTAPFPPRPCSAAYVSASARSAGTLTAPAGPQLFESTAAPLSNASVTLSLLPAQGGTEMPLFNGKTDESGTLAVAFAVPEGLAPDQRLIVRTESSLGRDELERPDRVLLERSRRGFDDLRSERQVERAKRVARDVGLRLHRRRGGVRNPVRVVRRTALRRPQQAGREETDREPTYDSHLTFPSSRAPRRPCPTP